MEMASSRLATGLKALFLSLLCLMVATLIYTIAIDGFPFPSRHDVFTPWFTTTVVDFYINIVPIAVWISYKESNLISAFIWIIFLVLFGSITTCAYVFLQLMRLKPVEASEDPMYHLLLRDSDKEGVDNRTKHSPIITTRIIFGALGCLMLGTLLYTILTDGSPFRKELLYPWMVVLLTSFYIDVVALSVWAFYKESSLILAAIWVVLFICFGSITTSAYIVVQLLRLSSQDPLYHVLLHNKNRAGNGYEKI